MLRRPPTKIELKLDDVKEYEKIKKDAELARKLRLQQVFGPGSPPEDQQAKTKSEVIMERIGIVDPKPKKTNWNRDYIFLWVQRCQVAFLDARFGISGIFDMRLAWKICFWHANENLAFSGIFGWCWIKILKKNEFFSETHFISRLCPFWPKINSKNVTF